MAEFDSWWAIEEKADKRNGGAKAAAACGYSRLGTYNAVPAFMSRQAGEAAGAELPQLGRGGLPPGTIPAAGKPIPGFSQMGLNEPAKVMSRQVASNRNRFGKDSTNGRPELDAKQQWQQQPKGRSMSLAYKNATALVPSNEKENFFQNVTKDRKPRHDKANKQGGG